ncbi:MAG: twin-arginine translocase TatA/TatE family subunit [Myxococcota bacterium]|nr:twin-arginine translocase TatA/TatE family subunit [Myxococcota bacterium]
MFGLGFGEIVVVLLVALLVLGPSKLPKLARQLGRGMREFRRAANEFQATLSEADLDRPPAPKPKLPTAAPADTISSEAETSKASSTPTAHGESSPEDPKAE